MAPLTVIVLVGSIRQWYGYVVQGRPYTSSEVLIAEGTPAGLKPAVQDGVKFLTGRCC